LVKARTRRKNKKRLKKIPGRLEMGLAKGEMSWARYILLALSSIPGISDKA
jgi:hypothetical protein